MTDIEGRKMSVNEARRTYFFPMGRVTFRDVREVIVRPSGSHRITTADGSMGIVSAHWIAIKIISPEGWGA